MENTNFSGIAKNLKMKHSPSISIIVAAYNIENYIERCLNSILNQAEKDFEVIVVNDGSTDTTGSIVSRFADNDSRVVVLTQKNMGLAKARQNGLNLAHGEYILFVDGDDFLMPHSIADMLTCARNSDADIVCFHWAVFEDGGFKTCRTFNLREESCTFLERLLLYDVFPTLSTKLIRAGFILSKQLTFPPPLSYGEDIAFIISIAVHNPKAAFLDKPLYYYFTRPGSLTQSPTEKVLEISIAVNFAESILLAAGLAEKYRNEFLFFFFMHNFFWRLGALADGNRRIARKLYLIIKNKRRLMMQNSHIKKFKSCISRHDRLLIFAFNINFNFGRMVSALLRIRLSLIQIINQKKWW